MSDDEIVTSEELFDETITFDPAQLRERAAESIHKDRGHMTVEFTTKDSRALSLRSLGIACRSLDGLLKGVAKNIDPTKRVMPMAARIASVGCHYEIEIVIVEVPLKKGRTNAQ